eukprot:5972476-Alexandrium_andersonii.AAC.1
MGVGARPLAHLSAQRATRQLRSYARAAGLRKEESKLVLKSFRRGRTADVVWGKGKWKSVMRSGGWTSKRAPASYLDRTRVREAAE